MFHEKTTFVIGAGASKEAGLPVGEALAGTIANLMYFEFDFGRLTKGDSTFLHSMQRYFPDRDVVNEHLRAARQIWGGIRHVKSIDNYIDTHKHNPHIGALGKAAIAYSILKAEKASPLWLDPHQGRQSTPLNKLADTWFVRFGQQLVEQVSFQELDNVFNNINVICFNYDRCTEEFLRYWLMAVYSIDDQRARRLVNELTIIRPYGKVGDLATISFGNETYLTDIFHLSGNINTYTEQISDTNLTAKIEKAIGEAHTLVFLGFAFHPPNMKVLAGSKKWQAKRILASAIGFSDSDVKGIERQLLQLTSSKGRSPTIDVNNKCTCYGLFSEYSRAFKSVA